MPKKRHSTIHELILAVLLISSLQSYLLGQATDSAAEDKPRVSNDEANSTTVYSAATTVRVASISFVPQKLDLAGNMLRLESAFRKAKKGNAEIAVAPEGALDGYIVNEIIAGKIAREKMRDVAISIQSAEIEHFRKLARELDMCLVFGFAELIAENVFNCAIFIDNKGEVCGKYHKMQFAEGYDPTWWFNRLGTKSRSFETPFGRCGILICNDRWNPQLAKIPAADGAQFLVIPAFGSRSTSQDKAVLSRAQENDLPIIEANVGVSLIVSDNRVAAVNRVEEGVTFANIKIPNSMQRNLSERDRVEREFLSWRETEMQERLDQHLKKLGR